MDQIFYIRQILDKKWEYNGTVRQLFIDFKKAYDSVKREVLCNILLEFGVSKKLVRLIKMCLNETYSKVRIGKYLSDAFPIQSCLKEGHVYHQQSPRKLSRFGNEWDISAIGLF
jgi:hypothetical protein